MKVTGLLCLSACILLGGCASSGFMGFLATTPYVRERVGEVQSESSRSRQEILVELAQLQREVEEFKRLTGEVEELLRRIALTEKNTHQLRVLTTELQIRLEMLPRETLEELVRIIEVHLESSARLRS